MATQTWRYLINTFEVNTRGSHVKGLSIAADHDAKLHAEDSDPDILALYTPFHMVYQAYAQICSHFDSVTGIRKGMTVSIEAMLDEDLPEQLRVWEGVVRAVHPEDSPAEVMIFPKKRTPFLQGTYEDRIGAIDSLIESLEENGGFATLVTQVQSFYNLAMSTRNTQQQKEGLIGQSSDLRENQRLLVMQEMHGNLGELIHKFRADIQQVERFFDLSLLRETGEEDDGEPSIPTTSFVIKGKVTNAVTEAPLNNATVFFAMPDGGPGFSAISNINGDYEFRIDNLPAHEVGVLGVSVTGFPGFQNFSQNQNVETGNVYTLDIALHPA